ncbi:MAG TPA: hypothetical protein VLP43_11440 [Solirubrobacteraceae bacterium]|nr:hypothetical protein [Solirubrobacteraceae bacterium]
MEEATAPAREALAARCSCWLTSGTAVPICVLLAVAAMAAAIGLVAGLAGWRMVFAVAGVVMLALLGFERPSRSRSRRRPRSCPTLGEAMIGLFGLFGLAGAAGASMAPIAGRLADRGHARRVQTLLLGRCWRAGPCWPGDAARWCR